ncbi:hypothetical protein Pmani_018694 [Petrolisthes manimaculis]|uniref:HTH psq-type domain-containing protein n=1 Tax=Petrolisthes manimaculis TaxID=1843537 RepID=A0AAE1U6G5_9EUCA|nr:hypothetical protein Pmani_018694 [Petrolisthes manimaculis]
MPRSYKKLAVGASSEGRGGYRIDKAESNFQKACDAIRNGELSVRQAAKQYGFSKSTLHDAVTRKHIKPSGGQTVLSSEEEDTVVENLLTLSQWGFPLDSFELRLLIKQYLDRRGVEVKRFKNNLPGCDWAKSFLKRHRNELSHRLSQNIKVARAKVTPTIIRSFFNNLENTLNNVPPENIINYDETNLSDDPRLPRISATTSGVTSPTTENAQIQPALNESLISMLSTFRYGPSTSTPTRGRKKKMAVSPGKSIRSKNLSTGTGRQCVSSDVSGDEVDDPNPALPQGNDSQPSTSKVDRPSKKKLAPKRQPVKPVSDNQPSTSKEDGPSSKKRKMSPERQPVRRVIPKIQGGITQGIIQVMEERDLTRATTTEGSSTEEAETEVLADESESEDESRGVKLRRQNACETLKESTEKASGETTGTLEFHTGEPEIRLMSKGAGAGPP